MHRERLEERAPAGFSLATDIAEWLVKQGVPFLRRDEVAGECVKAAEAEGKELADLTDEQFAKISTSPPRSAPSRPPAPGALASRDARGGTAPSAVAVQLAELKANVEQQHLWADAKH
ncbi:Argininosuccinate lyase OS=Streptomyces fumanus OX=67302 GN=argH PE=3 SV=1 [Streptomyces fumanus]